MKKDIQVGLIGFGMAGRVFHAPFIANVAGLKLRKIRETKQANIHIANTYYPEAEIVGDSKAILQDPEIDLVVVASPNATHYSLAKEALEAGKHVLVDKPFTVTSAEARELIQLAEQQQKVLTVFQNRRWDSDFKTVKKIVENQLLGNLVEYEAHFDRFRNFIKEDTWKEEDHPGSGILYDLGAHLIDQSLYLFGKPEAVTADLRAQRQGSSIIDHFDLTLHYPQLKVILKAGMLVKETGPHFRLLGDQGSFTKYGMDVQEEALKANQHPKGNSAWGIEPENLWGSLQTTFNGLQFRGKIESETGDYTALYQNVYNAILGEEELVVKPEQAQTTIQVIEAAYQSHQERRTVFLNAVEQ
ncbi:oxidoreductase [Pontibacter sp. SGAir0037]|uniref:oxidoreductase n=1 Tax=Pontibacter sp. SGAir0037 TaxID=2571030 RepID=UPI0010CD0A65|nr:oxidoreductase [Pontibacter sp. SGAir0037]QCR21958.1 oxidoreductase [Pontibacter sp. SGAir0037]